MRANQTKEGGHRVQVVAPHTERCLPGRLVHHEEWKSSQTQLPMRMPCRWLVSNARDFSLVPRCEGSWKCRYGRKQLMRRTPSARA